MDMLSPAQQKALEWPQAPAQRGKYYGVPDPVHAGHQLVVMLSDTWLDFGTMFESVRRGVKARDEEITELNAVIAQLSAKVNDLEDRLVATRDARKKEKLAWLGLGPRKDK